MPDGDGQYFHYLCAWMFTLSRMSVATGDPKYNQMGIQLAKGIHDKFVWREGTGETTQHLLEDVSRPKYTTGKISGKP